MTSPEKPETSTAPSTDGGSSAPPPWQRVATDVPPAADQKQQLDQQTVRTEKPVAATPVGTGAVPPAPAQAEGAGTAGAGAESGRNRDAATERFEDWGYAKAGTTADNGSALRTDQVPMGGYTTAMADAATSSVYAGQRIGSLPKPDHGVRTTVNLGAPNLGATTTPGPAAGAIPGGPAPSTPIRPSSPPPTALRRPGRGPRRASLQIRRVDPWSVLKLAFVLSVALFFVWMVAVGVLYGVLDGMGVWAKLNGTYNEFAVNTSAASSGPLITVGRVLGIAAIIGAINIVLFTALATVGAFVYNVSADLAGGLEMTLAERE